MTLEQQKIQKPRKSFGPVAREPRLNIRYPNFEIIDEIELDARKLGIKKNGWVKLAIQEKLERDSFKRIFEEERIKGDFETRHILRKLAGDDLSAEANSRASDYIREVMHDVL